MTILQDLPAYLLTSTSSPRKQQMAQHIQALAGDCSPERQAYGCCTHCSSNPAGRGESPLKAWAEKERLRVTA